jgi:hypothetical protein
VSQPITRPIVERWDTHPCGCVTGWDLGAWDSVTRKRCPAHAALARQLMHPDRYGDGPQRWPDGSLVVLDATLEPGEFS